MLELTSEQFNRTRRLALRLAGIELVERHRELLRWRSRRLGIRDAAGMDGLLQAAEADDPQANRRLVDLVTTKFTGFFRHPRHFVLAAARAVQAAQRKGQARLWSAGAATGEEPYSLAMALIEAFGRDDPPATILATDINEAALAKARQGEYREQALVGLAPERRGRFFTDAGESRLWKVTSAGRRLVEFRLLNLTEPAWPVEGPFDIIFCRNVLMYLATGNRHAALEHMASVLAPDGLLIIDPAEHLGAAGHLFGPEDNGVYSRKVAAHPRTTCR